MPKKADYLGSWFREYTDCYRNRKLRRLSEAMQLRFVWFCALHKEGKLVGASVEDIAYDLRLPEGDVQETIDTLRGADLIGRDNAPLAWEERQPKSDTSRERTAAWRDKQRERHGDGQVTSHGDVTVTSPVTPCDSHGDGVDQTRPDKKGGDTRARARASAGGATDAAPAPVTPGESPPLPASQGETGKATTANVSATPAQLEMLAGLATKRALRLPDVCQALGIAVPVPKAEVDRIIAHLEALPPVPPAARKRQLVADQAPVLWGDVSQMLDAGDIKGAHDALRGAREPELRRHVLRQLVAYLGQRGDLTGAMLAVGSDHDTLIRDLPVVWEALLSSKRYTEHGPPGTGLTDADFPAGVA